MGIFDEQIARKPDRYPWAKTFIQAMHKGFWTVDKFDFSRDIQEFKVSLTEQERALYVRSLATIGQVEVSVKKFWAKLGDNLPHPAFNDLGFVMANVEVIHGDAYEKLLSVLGLEDTFEEILQLPIIKGRVNYLRKHLHKFHSDNKKQFVYSLILFTLFVENLALFSQFYAIRWFTMFKNVMKTVDKQVEYTSREENLHAMVGIKTVNEIRKEHPELFDAELEEKVLTEAAAFMKYEREVLRWIIGDYEAEGLSVSIIEAMLQDRLNKSLVDIGYKPIFEVDDDLVEESAWFNEVLLGGSDPDFFDGKPSEYSKTGVAFSADSIFS
jgi:ribonucleoside-diphosphate reductase beta chain